jgi:hypothetical protein
MGSVALEWKLYLKIHFPITMFTLGSHRQDAMCHYRLAPKKSSTNCSALVYVSHQVGSTFNKDVGRGFNSLVLLGAWILWKEKNNIVFNGVSPRLDRALLLAQDEADH